MNSTMNSQLLQRPLGQPGVLTARIDKQLGYGRLLVAIDCVLNTAAGEKGAHTCLAVLISRIIPRGPDAV